MRSLRKKHLEADISPDENNSSYHYTINGENIIDDIREFDTFPNEKQRISRMNAYIFLSNLLFLYIGFFGFLCYNGIEVKKIEGQYIKIKKR